MPDDGRPDHSAALTALLPALPPGPDGLPTLADAVAAWLWGLAVPRLGADWCTRHLPPAPWTFSSRADAAETSSPCPSPPNGGEGTPASASGSPRRRWAEGDRGRWPHGHPGAAVTPHDIVATYEAVADTQVVRGADGRPALAARPFARRSAGAFYTPPALVDLLLDRARVATARRVLDPACGAGAFLLGALDRLAAAPAERPALAERALFGVDLDPLAVACARVAVALAATPPGAAPPELTDRIVRADALLPDPPHGLDWTAFAPAGGFDAVVGNPPWERVKLQQVEWLAAADPAYRGASAAERRARLAELEARDDSLRRAYAADRDRRARLAAALRRAYPEVCGGDPNLYAGFVALAARRIAAQGRAALLVPSGLVADRHTAGFVARLAAQGRLAAVLDFENRRRWFPGVDGRFKFACLVLAGADAPVARSTLAFGLRDPAELACGGRPLQLSPRALATLNPNHGGLPVLRSRSDAALALRLHRRGVPLVDRRCDPPACAYPVRYRRLLDMTNHAHRFRPAAAAGPGDLPLYEGKMVQAYDHRAASVDVRAGNLKRPGQPRSAGAAERADPHWRPQPRFAVAAREVDWPDGLAWAIGLKHVTSPSNARSVIAAAVPRCAAANSLPLLLPAAADAAGLAAYRRAAPLLLANLNALVFDWLARGKLQGQNLNLYILEQLPVIPPAAIPAGTAEAIRAEVRALSHTAHDLDGFARDLGHTGPPAPFDPADRADRRARLDAMFARLYGLSRAQLVRVLDGFPQLHAAECRRDGGRTTGDLTLRAFDSLAARKPPAPSPSGPRQHTFA